MTYRGPRAAAHARPLRAYPLKWVIALRSALLLSRCLQRIFGDFLGNQARLL